MIFEAPKGRRVLGRYIGLTVSGMLFDVDSRLWATAEEHLERGYCCLSDTMWCHSFRAFKRFVRKHPEMRGKIHLYSRYVGHDVYA